MAFKAENAVDMETGAIVAVTTHGGAAAHTTTIQETVIEAAIAVCAPLDGVQEVVADKGYHSNQVVLGLDKLEVRTYMAEPDRGPRNWLGKAAEKAGVYGSRRRIQGNRGKSLQRHRGERIERKTLSRRPRQCFTRSVGFPAAQQA